MQVSEIFYVDGGCDSIMRGCEIGLATPTEDMFTLQVFELAVQKMRPSGPKGHSNPSFNARFARKHKPKLNPKRSLIIVGLDLDTAHGILLQDLDDRVSSLTPKWVDNMRLNQKHVQEYCDLVLRCNPEQSIVHSLVVGAIKGLRGYQVPVWLKTRLKKLLVPLSDRLTQMFCFDVAHILESNLYWKGIVPSLNCAQLDRYISD